MIGQKNLTSLHLVRQNLSLRYFRIREAGCSGFQVMGMIVVANFLSQVIFIFLLFQLHQHTLPYLITKEKGKVT